MMTYPFPLRRDGGVVFARLILPHDLSAKEAERIGDHIRTPAVDEQRALPRPPHPTPARRPTVDLPSLLSDLVPPLLVAAAKFSGDLYLERRRARSSKRDPSDEEPRGKHEKRS
jgi:hypothetical protein